MGRAMCKHVFGHMRSAKARIRLRICTVWSGPLLSANGFIKTPLNVSLRANAQMRLCACVGWIWICAFCKWSKTHFRLARPLTYCISCSVGGQRRLSWLVFTYWLIPRRYICCIASSLCSVCVGLFFCAIISCHSNHTVELRRVELLWDHGNLFETGSSSHWWLILTPYRKQMAII